MFPSLPGYAYSCLPGDVDYHIEQVASAAHAEMIGTGFGIGYRVQGGDLGQFRRAGNGPNYTACRGTYVNMMGILQNETLDPARMSGDEATVGTEAMEMVDTGLAFAL